MRLLICQLLEAQLLLLLQYRLQIMQKLDFDQSVIRGPMLASLGIILDYKSCRNETLDLSIIAQILDPSIMT